MSLALGQRRVHRSSLLPFAGQRKTMMPPPTISWPLTTSTSTLSPTTQFHPLLRRRRDRRTASAPFVVTRASSESVPTSSGTIPTTTTTAAAENTLTFRQRLAAAAAARPPPKTKKKEPLPARLLSSFLATSSVPYRFVLRFSLCSWNSWKKIECDMRKAREKLMTFF